MLNGKRLLLLLCVGLLLASWCLSAAAEEEIDFDRLGSIRITVRYDHEVVSGGTLTLYRVGELTEADGQYRFSLPEPFADSGVSLDEPGSAETAEALFAFANAHAIRGTVRELGENGTASFDLLAVGLYLLAQEDAAPGYEAINPFLISVPIKEDGTYVYAIDSNPKPTVEKEPGSGTSTESGSSSFDESSLPQTGQLNWPIPILTIAGLLLLSCGWFLYFGKKRTHEK